ncbi:MAG: asparaginase [Burkholderiaceae bacterium]|nr:asparaginase [Burkholderiaceae bacterium]
MASNLPVQTDHPTDAGDSARVIVVLATGGTIAGTAASASDHLGYTSAQLGIEQLLAGVPALAGLPIESEQVAQIDSKDMSHAIWQSLALRVAHHLARAEVRGIVVTHGTDTLEETAYFLHRVLSPAKPVVLTGAMRPATSSQADGPQNLLDAVLVARDPAATGVLAVLAGTVHGARHVRKVHPTRLNAFSSGEAGPLALIDKGRLVAAAGRTALLAAMDHTAPVAVALTHPVAQWPRVEIVHSHAGASGAVVSALCADGMARARCVDGLVVAATGNGTLHRDLEAALLVAQSQGIAVLRSLRCGDGRLIPLAGDRLPGADDLTPVQARIELMLSLMPRDPS